MVGYSACSASHSALCSRAKSVCITLRPSHQFSLKPVSGMPPAPTGRCPSSRRSFGPSGSRSDRAVASSPPYTSEPSHHGDVVLVNSSGGSPGRSTPMFSANRITSSGCPPGVFVHALPGGIGISTDRSPGL